MLSESCTTSKCIINPHIYHCSNKPTHLSLL
uniref:Uncharacterized protein n=1 Tax=Anguilla anguilla TaxID=7936 RepID=A0A0E9V4T7_ANGAN